VGYASKTPLVFSTSLEAGKAHSEGAINLHTLSIHDLHKNSKSAILREDIFGGEGGGGVRMGPSCFEGFGFPQNGDSSYMKVWQAFNGSRALSFMPPPKNKVYLQN
jgi:hypothetical protein